MKTENKSKEIALIAAIISDQFCNLLYEHCSYFQSLDYISDAAVIFYKEHKNTNWESVQVSNEFNLNGCDWEQFVVHWAYRYFVKKEFLSSNVMNPAEANF